MCTEEPLCRARAEVESDIFTLRRVHNHPQDDMMKSIEIFKNELHVACTSRGGSSRDIYDSLRIL